MVDTTIQRTFPNLSDAIVYALWQTLEDVPISTDIEETLEQEFFIFPVGTPKEDVWHWFDDNYSKGVASLLYNDGE